MHWKYLFAFGWLAFTISLLTWWIFVIHNLIDQVGSGDQQIISRLPGLKNMVFWEGGSLILLIIVGAIPLIYLIYRERNHSLKLQEFFATFSHDLKTSMASLMLQTESLAEETQAFHEDQKALVEPLTQRILTDAGRLHLQLENSLFISYREERDYFFEKLNFYEFVENLKLQWPSLEIEVEKNLQLLIDRRALESIFNNLCQNSSLHGGATDFKIQFEFTDGERKFFKMRISDNGKGCTANLDLLGKPFLRHSKTSGSGMGLFIVREIVKDLGGQIDFLKVESGFALKLMLPIKMILDQDSKGGPQ